MRTIIELPDELLESLGQLCQQEQVSRAELIRRAVGDFLKVKRSKTRRDAFGLWKAKKVNALKYESRLRAEWGK